MSYDIHLVLVGPGESVIEVARRDHVSEAPYTSEAKTRNDEIVSALTTRFPGFKRFDSDRHVELTDVDGGTGMQVSLYADSGGISVPYWHNDSAAEVLRILDEVLRIVLENGPFLAFDPQTDQELKPGALQQPQAREVYAVGIEAVRAIVKRPWWRFWN
jgi:hypothetical protein